MQIADITRNKKKQISEVNWGAIGGALAGIAKQSATGNTPSAAPGQEAQVSKQLLQPLQNQQINSVMATWNTMISNQMAKLGKNDPNQLPTQQLTSMLTNYIDRRLLAGQQEIRTLPGKLKTDVTQDITNIISATKTGNQNAMSDSIVNLVKNIQKAMMTQTYYRGASQATLTPVAQTMMQRMAPQIAQLQRSWPQNQTQQVMPTNNQAVNALLAGLGLLKTTAGPVSNQPAQTPSAGTEP